MTQLDRVIFTGGGTGGHLYPGLALVEELQHRNSDFQPLFIGSERGIELRILKEAGYHHRPLPIRPSTDLKQAPFSFLWSYWKARRQAQHWIQRFQPQVVVGLGGFASVPVVQAAQSLEIPTVLLEQNTIIGRANRLLAKRATCVCHSFSESLPTKEPTNKHRLTGNPVRREVSELTESERKNDSVRTILILGGSQGAQAVNRMWLSAVKVLKGQFESRQILHQSGEYDCEMVRETYRDMGLSSITEPFFEVLPTLYRQADLVISRAGATTLAELACAGLPAILIPYPNSIGNHQQKNAKHFEQAGAALIASQSEDPTSPELAELVKELLDGSLAEMQSSMRSLARPDAARHVVDIMEQCVTA